MVKTNFPQIAHKEHHLFEVLKLEQNSQQETHTKNSQQDTLNKDTLNTGHTWLKFKRCVRFA